MKAPLIFCSTSHSINIQKIFKIVLSKVSTFYFSWISSSLLIKLSRNQAFDLKCNIPEITETGEPLLICKLLPLTSFLRLILDYLSDVDV